MNNCEKCGIAAELSSFTMKQHATVVARERTKVLVVLPQACLNEGDNPGVRSTGPHFLSTLAAQFFIQMLENAGFSRQEIENSFSWTLPVRCPGAFSLSQANLCADYLKVDVQQLKPALVLLCDGTSKEGRLSNELKQLRSVSLSKTCGRVTKLEEVKFTDLKAVTSLEVPVKVMRVLAPHEVLRSPETHAPGVLLHDLKKIRGILDGTYPADPFSGVNYRVAKTEQEALSFLSEARDAGTFAWDIETFAPPYSTDPYSKKFGICGLSISWAERAAVFVPLDHPECFLGSAAVWAAVKETLETAKWTYAHNGVAFDAHAMLVHRGIAAKVDHDTMLADGEIDENRVHSLKFLTELFFPDLGHYEDGLMEYVGKTARARVDYSRDIPLSVLGRYACADADATFRLAKLQEPLLKQRPHRIFGTAYEAFLQHRMPDARAAVRCTINGSKLDEGALKEFRDDIEAAYSATAQKLREHPAVQQFQVQKAGELAAEGKVFVQADHIYMSWLGASQGLVPVYRISDGADLVAGAREKLTKELRILQKNGAPYVSKVFTADDVTFNPGSGPHIAFVCSRILRLESPVKTPKGNPSWSNEAVLALAEADTSGFLALLQEFRHVSKDATTYSRPLCQGEILEPTDSEEGASDDEEDEGTPTGRFGVIRDDGYLHGEFMLCGADRGKADTIESAKGGTKTKRKSCARPNMQNMHKHSDTGKRLYGLFVSRYHNPEYPVAVDEKHVKSIWKKMSDAQRARVRGFVKPGEAGSGALIQTDYSQLELRIFAIVANISWMLRQYSDPNADLHTQAAMTFLRLTKEEALANDGQYRAAAKSLWFGPIYGEGVAAMRQDMLKKVKLPSRTHPGEVVTIDEVKEMYDRLMQNMPEFRIFKDRLGSFLKLNGYVEAVSGSRRTLPHINSTDSAMVGYAMRQAVNFCVQNPGAECLNGSSYRIQDWLDTGTWNNGTRTPVLANQVHDSIVLDVPSEYIPLVAGTTKIVMESPYIPELHPSNSPIPLKTDCEVGPTWGWLAKYAPPEVS